MTANAKKILIFGGAGFIGAHFIRHWRQKYPDWKIVVFDALTYSGDLARLADYIDPPTKRARDGSVSFIHGSIVDAKLVGMTIREERPDYIVNFAAETHVDRSIHVGAKEFIDTNVTGVFNILEAVKKHGCAKFVQVSTDEVYGQLSLDAKEKKFTEETPFKPNVPYSATKAAGDLLCNAYFFTWRVPVVVTHCSNNYGEWQYPEKLIPYITHRLLSGDTVPIYGDGLNVRDWIYVGDHVRALDLVLASGKPGEVYNIGADNERNNLEIAKLVIQYLKPGIPDWKAVIEFVPDRPGHDRRYAIDAVKTKRELGWAPLYGAGVFEQKLRETIEWYKGNTAWCREIQLRTGVANAHTDLWEKTMSGTLSPRT
jgi:dTDP-glucose 4,6-dehydratase